MSTRNLESLTRSGWLTTTWGSKHLIVFTTTTPRPAVLLSVCERSRDLGSSANSTFRCFVSGRAITRIAPRSLVTLYTLVTLHSLHSFTCYTCTALVLYPLGISNLSCGEQTNNRLRIELFSPRLLSLDTEF